MAGDSDLLNRLVKVLGAFDDSALAALTSVGLVRRARKDLEKETVTVESQPAVLQIIVGDGMVSMTETGPAEARCTCPAGGKCRHVLVAVLYLKEKLTLSSAPERIEATTAPAISAKEELLALTEDELAKWVGRKTLRDAVRLVESASDIEIIEDTAVTVRFPSSSIECRYFAGAGLAGVVTAAPSKLRERFMAAAVLAYQRHHGMVHAIETAVPASKAIDAPRTPQEILQSTISLLEEMITIGITHVSGSVRDRLQTLSVSCVGSNLPRLSLLLKSLADEVAMALRRDAGADDARMFNTMARTYALCSAIATAGDSPPLSLLGQSRSRYEHTGAMDLTGVGAYAWRTRSGYHGVTVLFWDSMPKQFCSWSDSRPVSQDLSFSPVSRYEQDLPWRGSGSARMMSRSRFKLSGASRNEDHRLSGSEQCRAVILNDTDPSAIDFGGRVFTDWNELRRYLASVTSAGLAEYSPLDRVVVLKPAAWGPRVFLPAEQTLVWALLDDQGRAISLTLPFDAVSARAVRFLETIDPQSDPPSTIVGSVSFDGAQMRLYPYSLLTNTGTTRVRNLSLDPAGLNDLATEVPSKKANDQPGEESATETMTAALAAVFAQWSELEDDLQQLAESNRTTTAHTRIPVQTGMGKTGVLKSVERTVGLQIQLPTTSTLQGLIAELGKCVPMKDWQKLDANAIADTRIQCERDARSRRGGRLFAVDEATTTLGRLCGAYDSKSPAKDLGSALILSDSGGKIDDVTAGNGARIYYDSCISFVGFTQLNTWREWLTEDMKSKGMMGRILPSCAPVSNIEPANIDDVTRLLKERHKAIQQQLTEVDFGVKSKEIDPIGDVKRRFRETDLGRYFADVFETDFALLENKLLNHAIRMAMICVWADATGANETSDTTGTITDDPFEDMTPRRTGADEPTIKTVDGLKWFEICHEIAAKEYLAYLFAITEEKFTPDETAFLEVLKRRGAATASEIKRNSNRLKKISAQQIGFIADGLIEATKVVAYSIGEVLQYRLKV